MAKVELQNVLKRFGDTVAVNDVSFTIEDGDLFALLGPSGCGKTTTLRSIAGLEYPTEGRVFIGDDDVTEMAPRHRDIAMVFQNLALYPHKTVRKNMAFPLTMRGYEEEEIDERVTHAASILEISELLDRLPGKLSGGQQQRVALGRAIVRDPGAFLMDEPLSSLDAKLREQMRAEILELHQNIDSTIIYVTHDQEVAMTLGDQIGVMNDGELEQMGPPNAIYRRPATQFVATFIGNPDMNFFDVSVSQREADVVFENDDITFSTPKDAARNWDGIDGREVRIGVRPQDVHHPDYMSRDVETGERVTGEVALVEEIGSVNNVHIEIGGTQIIACLNPDFDVAVGDTVELVLDTQKIHVFDISTGDRIPVSDVDAVESPSPSE